ncbi:hypothetical protein [Bradyrhizobium sp. B120]|uniref:hypothetical protein n=1 Tax=Bradyrhizobium sp. B120 TaxID=3410088 RepID=UPI003B983CBA
MQDFGDCVQSSQIGPHRVQLPSASPIAITPPSNTNLRNMDAPTTDEGHLGAKTGAFSSRARCLQRRASASDSSAGAPEHNAGATSARWFDRAAPQTTLRNKAEKESTT